MKYKVILPIDVDGRIYHYGDIVELDLDTAVLYAHALIAQEEEGK